MKPQYLYFPNCKIADANLINTSEQKIVLYIKSKETTPVFYPSHDVLKGKVDLFFKFEINQSINNFDNLDAMKIIFGDEYIKSSFKKIKSLKKKEISTLCFFNPESQIICDCLGLGQSKQMASFFNLDNVQDMKQISQMVFLDYQLQSSQTDKGSKRVKI